MFYWSEEKTKILQPYNVWKCGGENEFQQLFEAV